MAQLGCNYSSQLMTLLHESRVDVDWIKLARWDILQEELAVARPLRPVLLHVLPHATKDALDQLPTEALNEAIRACGSPHLALHLEARVEDFDARPGDREVVERMVAVTSAWAGRLAVPLLIENVPFYGWRGTLRPASDPATIREVCERTGADLLLDLAHARVAAWHRQEDVRTWLSAIPLERVREIHLSGPALDPAGRLVDRHLELQEEDYGLLGWALQCIDPLVVTLEYSGTGPVFEWRSDPIALERQLTRLRAMVG